MARSLVAIGTVLLFLGLVRVGVAQQDFEAEIAGKWSANVAKTKAYLKEHNLTTDGDEDFLAAIGKLTVEFGAEHSVVVREDDNEQMRGQWKLVKEEDALITIELIRDDESTPATIEILDNDSIAITPGNERPLVLTRSNKAAVEGVVAKLVGTWVCDKDATLALKSNKDFTQEQLDMMMEQAGGMVVTFGADGAFSATMVTNDDAQDLSGTWEASDADEAKSTFSLSLKAEHVPDSLNVEIRDDGSVCFSPPGQPTAVFVKKTEKK